MDEVTDVGQAGPDPWLKEKLAGLPASQLWPCFLSSAPSEPFLQRALHWVTLVLPRPQATPSVKPEGFTEHFR